MEINPEIFFEKSPKPVSFENTEKILYQMKNCICKIYKNNGEKGTGFFCKIPYPNQSKLLKVLITNNHVLNEDDLKNDNIIKYTLKDDEEIREIILDNNKRKIYTSKELDISFIEIKENEDNINEYLEIDEEIINKNKKYIETTYKNKSIYILHYPLGEDIVVSYGNLDKIKNEQINHFCNTSKGSLGSPILSLDNFKVIGIHCGSNRDDNENCNKGIFIKYPINLFNKKIFILSYKLYPDYFNNNSNIRIFGDKFVENNKDKCIMIINDKEYKLSEYVNKEIIKNESFEIKLKEIETINDMSYMFYKCYNIPDISKWNTSNVINMSYMFNQCKDIPDISKWNTSNVINMSYMFYECNNIPDISKWDTSNVTDMSFMFSNCNNIPDISNWNTSNVINMSHMFHQCKDIPDISKWNTSNVNNFNLSILKLGEIKNIYFYLISGKIITIIANEFMTFSNVVKILYTKVGISNETTFTFLYNAEPIDPNSNKLIKELFLNKNPVITTYY